MKIKSNYILIGIAILAILLGVFELVHIKYLEGQYETVWAEVTDVHRSKIRTGLTQAHIKVKYHYEGKEYEATLLRKEQVDNLKGLYIYCEKDSPKNVIDIEARRRKAIIAIVAGTIVLGITICAEKSGRQL